MKTILCYGDSLSWGIVPGTRKRLAFEQRWPGILQLGLGAQVRVLEDCLNGRTSQWDDPYRPRRNGLELLQPALEMHAPLDLVILFLGINDLQDTYNASPEDSAEGIRKLVQTVQTCKVEPNFLAPRVLLLTPPKVIQPRGMMKGLFKNAATKAELLSALYQKVAEDCACEFLDTAAFIQTSAADGVHIDAEAHHMVGRLVLEEVRRILALDDHQSVGLVTIK